jgi:glutathione-independent formaldehyde dehydrogenase
MIPSFNRAVCYAGQDSVEVKQIAAPKFEHTFPNGETRRCEHGAIVKLVASNICGSDLHIYRGRTSAKKGLVLGHEITGEVVAIGRDVEFIQVGDLVSVPFNISCGKCRNCREQKFSACLNVNPIGPGGVFGFPDYGDWLGGQAEYVMVPYADWNMLKFPYKDKAMSRILDLAMLTDILPTGFHGATTAGVCAGSTVYIAGAGPVGLACAASCNLLGAASVIVGDMNADRLLQAAMLGCHTIDLSKNSDLIGQIDKFLGEPVVDCAVDCVGFEAHGSGWYHSSKENPNAPLTDCMQVTRVCGGIGIPGVYLPEDKKGRTSDARHGILNIPFGIGWAKGLSFATGQTPVMKYNRQLMMAILFDKLEIASVLNTTVISLDDAPRAYSDFNKGVAKKFVIDPHGSLKGYIPRNFRRNYASLGEESSK